MFCTTYLRVYFLSQSTYKNTFYFSPDDGESDDRHLSEQPMTSINNSRLKIKGSTSGKSMSIINDFGKAMMYNCEPCGKLLNGAKAKNQHDRLVHSKVLYLTVLCTIFTIPLTFLGQSCNAYLCSSVLPKVQNFMFAGHFSISFDPIKKT